MASPAESLNRQNTILIVDDTPANIEVLSSALKTSGHKLAIANSGEKALQIVERLKPDLILLDVMMPGIDGFETCKRLKANSVTCDIPVIFITAKVEHADINNGFKVGAVDYVTKPFNNEEINSRVRTHLYLQESKRNLEYLNHQKDKFLGMVAHDLRNPLGAINGYMEFLTENHQSLSAPELEHIFKSIFNASDGMVNLLHDLLDTSALMSGHLSINTKLGSLTDLINARVKMAKIIADKKGINLIRNIIEIEDFEFDYNRISQVVDNLLSNAIKFSLPASNVEVAARSESGLAIVEVIDQGPGLTENDMNLLFGEFQKLSAKPTAGESSIGLGLAISKNMIQAHKGKIFARNNPEKGATFYFEIPMVENQKR